MNTPLPKRIITKEHPYQILFVCLGNICRSPTAEGVMQHLVNEAGLGSYFFIDSAGTSAFHSGEPANSKSRAVALDYGVSLLSRARQLEVSDLDTYDLILAMDKQNIINIRDLSRSDAHNPKIKLMREFDHNPGDGEVPDPYYGGLNGFHDVFKIVDRSCKELLEQLKPMIKLDS